MLDSGDGAIVEDRHLVAHFPFCLVDGEIPRQ